MTEERKTYSVPPPGSKDEGVPGSKDESVSSADEENKRLYELMGRIVDTNGENASYVEAIVKLLTESSKSNVSKTPVSLTRLREAFFQTKISRLRLEIPKYLLQCKLKTGRNASEDNIRVLKQLCVGLEPIELPEKDKRKRETVYDSDAMVCGIKNI